MRKIIMEKPKKLNIKELWLDGRKLEDDEYEEIIFWDSIKQEWDSNGYRLIPKPNQY